MQVMASSNWAPYSGREAIHSKNPVPVSVSIAVRPVRTHSATSAHIGQCQGAPRNTAQSRTELGSPAQSGRARRVIAKRPSRRSAKIPDGVSRRSSLRRAPASHPVAVASCSAVRGPSSSWSAIPSLATVKMPMAVPKPSSMSPSRVTGGGRRRLRSRPSPPAARCIPAAIAGGGMRGGRAAVLTRR